MSNKRELSNRRTAKRPKKKCFDMFVDIIRADTDMRVHFYLYLTSDLGRVMVMYYHTYNKANDYLHFMFKGKIIDNDDTPQSLGMVCGDVIIVFNENKLAESKFN